MVKIYTKGGDGGQTSLRQGLRVPKDDLRVEANGELDELDSVIGVIMALLNEDDPLKRQLQEIQTRLMQIMGRIALLREGTKVPDSSWDEATADLEHRIDKLSGEELSGFVLPGGTILSACLHLARSKSRTCERRLWTLRRTYSLDRGILRYFNRLSDYFFALALSQNRDGTSSF